MPRFSQRSGICKLCIYWMKSWIKSARPIGQSWTGHPRCVSIRSRSMAGAVVSPEWVADRLSDPSVKLLDATWYMPTWGKNSQADFKAERIPGSHFYDTDGIADSSQGLPHMLPTEDAFAAAMDAMGVSNDSHVVLYDRTGIFSAPRAWWTLSVFGHQSVSVMEGGYPAWKALGLPVESFEVTEEAMMGPTRVARSTPPPAAKYRAKLDRSKVRDREGMLANINSKAEVVVDARSAGRFVGTEPEPRAGLRGGHIPGSRNLPFPAVLAAGPAGSSSFKSPEELRAVFSAAGVDLDGAVPVVGSCGSGLTACVLALAAYQASGKLIAVYDGSWMEWGSREDTPVSTDSA